MPESPNRNPATDNNVESPISDGELEDESVHCASFKPIGMMGGLEDDDDDDEADEHEDDVNLNLNRKVEDNSPDLGEIPEDPDENDPSKKNPDGYIPSHGSLPLLSSQGDGDNSVALPLPPGMNGVSRELIPLSQSQMNLSQAEIGRLDRTELSVVNEDAHMLDVGAEGGGINAGAEEGNVKFVGDQSGLSNIGGGAAASSAARGSMPGTNFPEPANSAVNLSDAFGDISAIGIDGSMLHQGQLNSSIGEHFESSSPVLEPLGGTVGALEEMMGGLTKENGGLTKDELMGDEEDDLLADVGKKGSKESKKNTSVKKTGNVPNIVNTPPPGGLGEGAAASSSSSDLVASGAVKRPATTPDKQLDAKRLKGLQSKSNKLLMQGKINKRASEMTNSLDGCKRTERMEESDEEQDLVERNVDDWKWDGGLLSSPVWTRTEERIKETFAGKTTTRIDVYYSLDDGVFKLPACVYEKLYPYQLHAVAWMWELHKTGKGGLFADEMGLGKTVMVCAFIVGLSVSKRARHFLIVLPNTLFIAWTEELEKWVVKFFRDQPNEKKFMVRSFTGEDSKKKRAEHIRKIARCGGALIIPYSLVRNSLDAVASVGPPPANMATAPAPSSKNKRNGLKSPARNRPLSQAELIEEFENDQGMNALVAVEPSDEEESEIIEIEENRDMNALVLNKKSAKAKAGRGGKKKAIEDDDFDDEEDEEAEYETSWDLLVCDEAHMVKDRRGQGAKALRQISAKGRLLLTGTPYHNHLSEIWSLADLAVPGLLGNFSTFSQSFADPILAGSKKSASDFEVLRKDKLSRELKNMLSKYFLRRDKATVLEDESQFQLPRPSIGDVGTNANGSSNGVGGGAGASSSAAGGGAASAADGALVAVGSASEGEGPLPLPVAMSKKKHPLPPKRDIMLFLNLTETQKELYSRYLKSDTVREARASKKSGIESFKAIALLKKVCDHPLMCLPRDPYHDDILTEWQNPIIIPEKPQSATSINNTILTNGVGGAAASSSGTGGAAASSSSAAAASNKPRIAVQTKISPEEQLHHYGDVDENEVQNLKKLITPMAQGSVEQSCKLILLNHLIPELVKRKHRILIFSFSTRMLDLIQMAVLRPNGCKFLRIDGNVSLEEREKKIRKFESDTAGKFSCMCLSTRVGGVGLTLTSADRVILVEPGWSPAIDQQAMDRAHRFGQKKEVVVYRLISHAAIEDKMFRVQVFKQGLCKTALEKENQMRYFNTSELKNLFGQVDEAGAETSTLKLLQQDDDPEGVLRKLIEDVGEVNTKDKDNFWTSAGVQGFGEYADLFREVEEKKQVEKEDEQQAKEVVEEAVKLLYEETYVRPSERGLGGKSLGNSAGVLADRLSERFSGGVVGEEGGVMGVLEDIPRAEDGDVVQQGNGDVVEQGEEVQQEGDEQQPPQEQGKAELIGDEGGDAMGDGIVGQVPDVAEPDAEMGVDGTQIIEDQEMPDAGA